MTDEAGDDYTPDADDVRESYGDPARSFALNADKLAEFDRWLAAHDREVSEKAWEEGWWACEEAHDGSTVSANPKYHVNPYTLGATP
jgi:hypothetical protein